MMSGNKLYFLIKKKLNRDDPFGYKHNWHNFIIEPKECCSRIVSKGSIIIWGVFAQDGFNKLQRISEHMELQKISSYIIRYVTLSETSLSGAE